MSGVISAAAGAAGILAILISLGMRVRTQAQRWDTLYRTELARAETEAEVARVQLRTAHAAHEEALLRLRLAQMEAEAPTTVMSRVPPSR